MTGVVNMNEVKKSAKVVAALKEACAANASVYGYLQDAAEFAADELNVSIPITESVDEVTTRYVDCFKDNHNLKSQFKNLLVCHFGSEVPVSIDMGKDKEPNHTTAALATRLSRHKMDSAAKQVREAYGTAREGGGGRTPRTPAAPQLVDWAKVLIDKMETDDGREEVKTVLAILGWQLRKAPVKAAA
jgi:hypothetical protein